MCAEICMYQVYFKLYIRAIQFRFIPTTIPNDNNHFALTAHITDLRSGLWISSVFERPGGGNRMHRARRMVLRLEGCCAEVTVMKTVAEGTRATDAGEVAQGVGAEELNDFAFGARCA